MDALHVEDVMKLVNDIAPKLVEADAAYTSQTCNECGCINNRLGYDHYGWLKVRSWQCPDCGVIHDRDINAAINIKNKGLMQLA